MKNITNQKRANISGAILLVAIMMISFSCSDSEDDNPTGSNNNPGGSNLPGANEVFIRSMAFDPSTITVAAGTTITWTNKDAVAHTVTSNTNLFNSGNLGTGKTFTFTFATPGTYSYYCSIHPSMIGSVTVN